MLILAFIAHDHWLEQQKCCPSPALLLSAKQWRCINHHSNHPANKLPLTGVGMSLGQVKIIINVYTWSYYDWTLAGAAKNYALPHCCWVPKNEDASTTMAPLQINITSMTETGWSIQKYCPATMLWSAKQWRCINCLSTPAKNCPWLVQVGGWIMQKTLIHVYQVLLWLNALAGAAKNVPLPHCC